MIRFRSSLLTGLIAAALLSGGAANAAAWDLHGGEDQQRRGYNDRPFGEREDPSQNGGRPGRGGESETRRAISESEALSRAQRQARGARFVGSQGRQGSSYVFLFERDGRTFTVSVSAYD